MAIVAALKMYERVDGDFELVMVSECDFLSAGRAGFPGLRRAQKVQASRFRAILVSQKARVRPLRPRRNEILPANQVAVLGARRASSRRR